MSSIASRRNLALPIALPYYKTNKKIEGLAIVATANALAHEQAKVLERQLANCQELLVSTRAELSTTKIKLQQQKLTTKTQLQHSQ